MFPPFPLGVLICYDASAMDTPAEYYRFLKMSLVLTSICNLRCKMCGFWGMPDETLPRETAFDAVDFAKRRGIPEVELGGGEPTLVPYFWDLLDVLCEAVPNPKVTTNGFRLSLDDVGRLASHPNLAVQVSIDGPAEVHDAIRGRAGAFAAAERSLRALAAAGSRVSINTTVQRTNFPTLVEVYEHLKDVPYAFHAFSLVEWDSHGERIAPESSGACIDVLKEVRRRAAADGKEVILSQPLLAAFRLAMSYPEFKTHPGLDCTVVRRGLIIAQNGTVLPCWHYPWDTSEGRRNATVRSLDEIVDSSEVRDELARAVAGGCTGCCTMCYNWDPDFQRKVMRPTGPLRRQRAWLNAKCHARGRFPRAFAVAGAVRQALGRRR